MTDTLDEIWDSLFGGGGPAEPPSSAPPQPSNPVVVVASRPAPVVAPPSIVVVPTRPAPTPAPAPPVVTVPTKQEAEPDDGEGFFADCCSRTCIIALLLLVASGASIGVIYVVVSLFNADVRDAYTDRINVAKNSFTEDVTRVRAIPSLYNSSDLAPVGTKGLPGGRGVIGPQGFSAPGATGEPGPYGPSATGIIGPTGAEGPRGPPGQVGERGPQGSTGPDGPQGATGIQGPRGVSGTCGGTCITYQSTINGTETTIWNAGLESNETALDYEIWHNASGAAEHGLVVNYTTGYIGMAHKHPLVPVHLVRSSNVSIGFGTSGALVLNATSSMTITTTMLNPLGGRVVTTSQIPLDFQSGGWDSDSVKVFNNPIYASNANISFVFGATDLNLLSSLLVPAVNCSSSLQCQRLTVASSLACIQTSVTALNAALSVITPVLISTSGYSPAISVVSATSTTNVTVATRLLVSTLVNATTAVHTPLLNATSTQATTLNTSTLVTPSVVATTSVLASSSLTTQTLQIAQNASLASATTMNSASCPVIQSTNFSTSGVFNCSLLSVPSMAITNKLTTPKVYVSNNATCMARTTAPSVSVTNTTTLLGPISVTSMCTVPDFTVSNTLTSSVLQIGTLYSNETLSQTTLSIGSSLTTDNITANRWGNDRLGYQILTPATGITNAGYPCRTISGAYSFSMPSTAYLSTSIKFALTLRCSVPERCALNYCCFKFPTGRPNGGNLSDQQFGYAKCNDTEVAVVSLPPIKQASSGGGCGCYWAGFQCATACGAGVVEINAWGVYGFGS